MFPHQKEMLDAIDKAIPGASLGIAAVQGIANRLDTDDAPDAQSYGAGYRAGFRDGETQQKTLATTDHNYHLIPDGRGAFVGQPDRLVLFCSHCADVVNKRIPV